MQSFLGLFFKIVCKKHKTFFLNIRYLEWVAVIKDKWNKVFLTK